MQPASGAEVIVFHSIMGSVYKSQINLKFEVQLLVSSLFSMLRFHSLLPPVEVVQSKCCPDHGELGFSSTTNV